MNYTSFLTTGAARTLRTAGAILATGSLAVLTSCRLTTTASAAAVLPAAAPEAATASTASAPSTSGVWNLPGTAPHLIFHYMPWFVTDHPLPGSHPWDHWKWSGPKANHDPTQRRPDGTRDIASVYYPLIGPYNSASRNVVRYDLQTMKAAGGEAVVVDWYGPGSYSDHQLPIVLEEAQRAGLKVTMCYEEKINFVWPDLRNPKDRAAAMDNAVNDFKYILKNYASSPTFLRRDGKPVMFEFNGSGTGRLGPNYFSPDEYVEIMKRLPEPIVFGRQGLEPAYSTSAQFRFLWWSSQASSIRGFARQARDLISQGKAQFFMSFITPGFNDTGVWGWNAEYPRVAERDGLSLLHGTFENSFTGDPELIQVVTWNDFNEGTVVEPTRQHGFQYLDAVATWWAQRKGRTADLDAIRAPFLNYVRTCTPEEKAELPTGSLDAYLAKRPLTVADPNFVEHAKTPAHM